MQEGDVVVVEACLGIIVRVKDDPVHLMVTLALIIFASMMLPW